MRRLQHPLRARFALGQLHGVPTSLDGHPAFASKKSLLDHIDVGCPYGMAGRHADRRPRHPRLGLDGRRAKQWSCVIEGSTQEGIDGRLRMVSRSRATNPRPASCGKGVTIPGMASRLRPVRGSKTVGTTRKTVRRSSALFRAASLKLSDTESRPARQIAASRQI
jgi:hypothetical protein